MAAIGRATRDGWGGFGDVDDDPLVTTLRDGIHRASAQARFHERITYDEKCTVWDKVGFHPTGKQDEIARDTHQIRHVRAGRRSGKTTEAAYEAIAVMVAKPGSFGWVVGPDYDLAFRCWDMIVKGLDKLAARGIIRYRTKQNTKSSMRIELDNGSVAEGQSAEDGDGLQGVGLDWLIMDEIAQIESWVFLQILFPAFVQKKGWAFLIGTPLGDSWASREYRHARQRANRTGEELIWSEYLYESWHNTYEFPGGRNDPEILKMERNMAYEDFMEQICAQPQRSRFVTYKEFNVDVHVRTCAYDPRLPVFLSIDPSTGVNPYAVGVFQDYGEMVMQIDEYYKVGVIAQDVIEDLSQRVWWANVQDALIDAVSWPMEMKQWRRHAAIHFPLFNSQKSQSVEDSIPLVREWLRDPLKWNALVHPIRDALTEELFPGKPWGQLEYEDQQVVNIRTEDEANRHPEFALEAARFFVDHRCRSTIDEFQSYMHKKPKRDDRNVHEAPIPHHDHLMDTIRYYLYNKKRYHGMKRARPRSYIEV